MTWDASIRTLRLWLSLAWLGFQIYILFSPQLPLIQCPLHLGSALALILLWHPATPGSTCVGGRIVDGLLVAGILSAMIYYSAAADRLTSRMEGVDPVILPDLMVGTLLVVAVLECLRRLLGWPLLSLILAFLAFGFVGTVIPAWVNQPWLPEMVKFSGFTLSEAVESLALTSNGLLGVTTSTSVLFVFYFIAFGAVYAAIGGGQLFTDIGLRVAGRQKGGTAKASVISSALMGTVSGSAVANVAADGIFTIPLMKGTGYSPPHAAAVEAAASTGGQLMPPVMGIAAFVMAELLQEPYARIALAGIIPALGFYFSLFLLVDLHARRTGLGVLSRQADAVAPILPRLYLLLPPILLVALLVLGKSASLAAAWATLACVPTSWLRPDSRRSWRQWLDATVQTCRQASEVAVPIAAIGIIIEVAVQSNLALKFSIFLVELGAGNALGSLVLIVLGCIVMGMGLPTVAAYLIGAIFFVPVMIDLGITPLAAHFFVMYYSVLSMITPPVALASITAAGLAKADTTATGLKAFRLCLVAFFIPFVFVFEPALLGEGTPRQMMAGILTLGLGVAGWAIALEGYCFRPLSLLQRLLTGGAALGVFLTPLAVDRLHKSLGLGVAASTGWAWGAALALIMAAVLGCLLIRPKPQTNANE